MNWLAIITFIENTITAIEPIIAAIIAEIQSLINGGSPVPASLYATLAAAQAHHAGAYAMLESVPATQLSTHAPKLVKP